jgi:hypothetical protein
VSLPKLAKQGTPKTETENAVLKLPENPPQVPTFSAKHTLTVLREEPKLTVEKTFQAPDQISPIKV